MPDPVERPYDCSEASVQSQDEDDGTRTVSSDCSDLPTESMQNKAFSHDTDIELKKHNNAQQVLKLACNNEFTVATDNNVEINSPSATCGAVPFMPESTGSSTEVIDPTAESDVQEGEENSNRPQDENHRNAGDVSGTLNNCKQIRVGIGSAVHLDNNDERDSGSYLPIEPKAVEVGDICVVRQTATTPHPQIRVGTGSAVCNGNNDERESVLVRLSIEQSNDNNRRRDEAAEVRDTCVVRQVSCDENSFENSLLRLKDQVHLSTVTRNNVDAKVFSLSVQMSGRIYSQGNQVQAYASTAMLCHDGRREENLQLVAQDNILTLKTVSCHSVNQAKVTFSVADSGLVPSDSRDALVRNKSAAIQCERKNRQLRAMDFDSVTQVEKDGRGTQANSILGYNQATKSAKNDLDFSETTVCMKPKNSSALQEEFDARGSLRTYHNNEFGIIMLIQMGIGKIMSKSRGHLVKARWLVVCPPIYKRVKLLMHSSPFQNDSILETTNLADTVTGKESIIWPCEKEYSEIVAVLINSFWTKETQGKRDIEIDNAILLPSRGYCHVGKTESLRQDVWETFTVVLLRFDLCEMAFQIHRNIQYCQVVISLLSNPMPPVETVKENQTLERTELFNTLPGNFPWDEFSTKCVSKSLNGLCALRDRLHFALSHKIDGKDQGMTADMFLMPERKQIVIFNENAGRANQIGQVSVAHGTFQVSPRPLKNAYITTSTIDFAACKILDRLQKNHRTKTSKSSRKTMLRKFQNNPKEAKILNIFATLNGDLKKTKRYSNAILFKDNPTRVHHGLYEIILQETRNVYPNWLFKPSTFQSDLCGCEANFYFTEVERTSAWKMMVIVAAATSLEGSLCVEKTGKNFVFLETGQSAFKNIHEQMANKLSKKVQFINDKMSASFDMPQVMDLVKNGTSKSSENDELGLRTLLPQKLKTKVLVWCILRKNLPSTPLKVLKLVRETIIDDNVSETIYIQTHILSNQISERYISSILNLEKTGEAVKKNVSLAIYSPNDSFTEGTERKTSFHDMKPEKEIVAALDEENSITGHGDSNEIIQLENKSPIQTVWTSSLAFEPEIHEIGSDDPKPRQSLVQTRQPNAGKRQDEVDSVGKNIIQVLNVYTQSAGNDLDHSDILYAPEKIELNKDHSTSGVVHESKSLSSALKQEEQVTAEITGEDALNTLNLEKTGEVAKKIVSSAINSANVSSTEGTERKTSFHGTKPEKEIVRTRTLDDEDSITGHGDSKERIQLRNALSTQTVGTSSLIFAPENHEIDCGRPNPGHSLVQKSLPISGETPETMESVGKITLVPEVYYTQPVGCNSKDTAVANENFVNTKLSEKNGVSNRSAEIDPPPTDQKPSYCVPVYEKQITDQFTRGPAEQGLVSIGNDKLGKDQPVPDSQLLNSNSLSNSKLIRDDEFDEIAAEKLMMEHMRLSKLCQRLDEFHSIQTSHFDMLAEPQVYEKTNWSPPLDVGMQDDHNRKISFNGRRNTRFSADDFSQGGFYLSYDNIVECYSCRSRHRIDDVTSAPGTYHYHQRGCQHLHNIRSRRNEPGVVETDGRVSDDIADPPGQQSLYIPPGDVRREAYRLSTFEHFPVTCPISRKSLAKSGFFFTGFYDRVKCFACARTVERWEETDNPAQPKWHKPTCPFPKGQECGNVSLPNLFQAIAPVPAAGSPSSAAQSTNQTTNQGERILEQRDPNSGAIIRRVRYPADLPERIRQTGGTFEIGPNNEVIIRSGPGPGERNPENVGLQATQQQPRRQWRMANVISADHKRFLTNLYLNRELDRLASFARWPTGRPNIAPAYLAKTGFFYLGDMDRTQCFSCGGVLRNWNLQDDAEAEHRTHFPQCRMVLNLEPRNIPVHENPETEEEKEQKYPLRFPANPHMRSENARLGTFDRRWPMGKTAATPAEIAQGGFFFLGDRDRAKCWYCNGGLQNWEYDDIPWIEHAKWFPNCQFLLRVKGQHFVYRHLALHPHLARPIIARQDGSPLESVGGQPAATSGGQARAQRSQDIPPSEPRVNQPSATPVIVDPRADTRKRKERVQNIMKNSDLVKNVLAMGFDDKIVASLLEDRIISGNEANVEDVYESASQLLDDVFKKEEEIRNQASTAVLTPTPSLSGAASTGTTTSMYSGVSGATDMSSLGPAPGSGKYNVSYFGDDDDEDMEQDMYGSMEGTLASVTNVTAAKRLLDAEENRESLQDALNKIEEERMCKICFTNQADMVFQPCAHMCCCMECTQAITQCPVCRKKIEKAIKTYVN